MSGTQETALTLARELSGAGEAEEALLELLCQAAEQQWEKRLRPGMTTEDCGKAFPCAVAFTAAADLAAARGGEGVSGFTAGFLSLCGGLLSLLVMWVLYYLLPVRPTWFILSVCGALAHNIGQLLGASVILSTAVSLYYAPVMLVLGLVMGALTSITLKALLPALGKMGFSTQEKRGE